MIAKAISQANGADLLQLLGQSTGGSATTAVSASVNLLKKALAEAQISEAAILNGDGGGSTGSLLNVFA